MIGKDTKVKRQRVAPNSQIPLVVGAGKNMQFNPPVFKSWQEDACDADDWKHGRVTEAYRDNYDRIFR